MSLFKTIAGVIVRSSGQNLPPNVLEGLTPQNTRKAKKGGLFSQFLNGAGQQLQGANTALQVPTPPTPPSDPNDPVAQQKYNEALLKYNQKFQSYHTQMMGVFSQRFMMMQQAIMQTQRSQMQQGQGASFSNSPAGTGGILEGSSSIDI
jgi:hypothetical protein